MSTGLTANRKFLIALIIGAIIAVISLILWSFNQTISLGVLVVAMAIPIVVYLMYDNEIDLEDLLDEQVETHEEAYITEVEEQTAQVSQLPIETIEGIGAKYGKMLRDGGITTVADLIAAKPEEIKDLCGVTTRKAERWIAMSRFAWLTSVSEEDAEAIVFATNIRELFDLAEADASELLSKIKKAVSEDKVEVPADYEFTLDKVKAWIVEAKDNL